MTLTKGSITMRFEAPISLLTLLTFIPAAQAQFRTEWSTGGADAQRSSWVRTDAKITPETMAKPGFEFLWKMKFANAPRQSNSLTAPVLMNQLIGYRGFRALAFIGGSSDKVFVVDSDLARNEWDKALPSAPAGSATPECPGGLTSTLARESGAAIAPAVAGAGPGRGSAARSAVGEPGQGAVTLAQVTQRRPPVPAAAPAPAPPKPAAPKQLAQDRRGNEPLYIISSSGMLHLLNVQNGADVEPAVKFLPPNSNAVGLTVLDRSIYAVTTGKCGGAPNAVWFMDRATKQGNKWESKTAIAGTSGAAHGADGSVYVATTGGEIVHLEAQTLKPLATYTAQGQEFNSSPVVFLHGGKTLVAALTKAGQLHVVNVADMTKAAEPATIAAAADLAPGALSSWQDGDGVRWLLAPTVKGVTAWKLTDSGIQPGWVSREITRPLQPMIVNGVVFAASTGKTAPATLYALDGKTGKELWNSGKTITSLVQGGGLAGAAGQIYLPTYDGTLYAFGFPIEH